MTESYSELNHVSDDPLVKESRIENLGSFITPTENFYIRNHYLSVPNFSGSTWNLEVKGQVNSPLSLTMNDIRSLPKKELDITLECAGNSRSSMMPQAEGIQFNHGAVSTGRFKGVSLKSILDLADLKSAVKEIIFSGGDFGTEEEDGAVFSNTLTYQRSLTLDQIRDDNILLAYEMNGSPLTRDHGFPLRLMVPGWYGMASVKWLVSIEATDHSFTGFFQKNRYVLIREGAEGATLGEPITKLAVKAVISTPKHGEVIPKGPFTFSGFAWSGWGHITKVELSVDGGTTWGEANLINNQSVTAWHKWEFIWHANKIGHFIVKARAYDSKGNVQPSNVEWNFRGYANNSIQTIAVRVASGRP
jgi:DMSO/TMAO reductase YedYZ molybdopterin-dependent catalytic subunit